MAWLLRLSASTDHEVFPPSGFAERRMIRRLLCDSEKSSVNEYIERVEITH